MKIPLDTVMSIAVVGLDEDSKDIEEMALHNLIQVKCMSSKMQNPLRHRHAGLGDVIVYMTSIHTPPCPRLNK